MNTENFQLNDYTVNSTVAHYKAGFIDRGSGGEGGEGWGRVGGSTKFRGSRLASRVDDVATIAFGNSTTNLLFKGNVSRDWGGLHTILLDRLEQRIYISSENGQQHPPSS